MADMTITIAPPLADAPPPDPDPPRRVGRLALSPRTWLRRRCSGRRSA